MLNLDIVVGDAERVGHELRERRFMSLPVRLRTSGDDGFASQVHLDVGAFPEAGAPTFALQTDPLGRSDSANLDV